MSYRSRQWMSGVLAAVMVTVGLSSGTGLTAAMAPASAQVPAPDPADAFYVPPDVLPAGAPGDIIRSRTSAAGPPSAKALADAWQVMYRSTSATGAPITMTGTVLVPRGVDRAKAPVIGLAPGTHGPARRCAPSSMIAMGAFYEQPALNDMLTRGYAVAVPDYEGYHPAPRTTYMTGRSMGHSLIDVVRAAQRLGGAGLSAQAPVVFRGYSQGGGAALWAGELRPDYAPELHLIGVAAGGVPADLAQVGLLLDGSDAFGFLLYALSGLDNAYPDVDLGSHLNAAGHAELARLADEVCVLDLILHYRGRHIADYTTTSPFTAALLGRIAENKLGGRSIDVPVLQYHESQDGVVAFGQASALRDSYCAKGVPLTWSPQDTGGENGLIRHLNLVYRGNQDVNQFIVARLAGRPATSNC